VVCFCIGKEMARQDKEKIEKFRRRERLNQKNNVSKYIAHNRKIQKIINQTKAT
jgi:hypothetical protein